MSIDISQFYQVFFDEAKEHLDNMESLLLSFDPENPDLDNLNAIFRSAHSIKGGGGTFGFNDLASVTHILETLLDRVRKGETVLTRDGINVFLQAIDVLRDMLSSYQEGVEVDTAPSLAVCKKLELLSSDSTSSVSIQADSFPGDKDVDVELLFGPNEVVYLYALEFPNSTSLFPSSDHLETLLNDLGSIGSFEKRDVGKKIISLALKTSAEEQKIRDIFSFFLSPGQLKIEVKKIDQNQSIGKNEGKDDKAPSGELVDSDLGYGFFTGVESHFHNETVRKEEVRGGAHGRRTEDRLTTTPLENADASIRVSISKVDKMINLVGELVITQSMLAESMLAEAVSTIDSALHERLLTGLTQLERNTRDLQESVLSVRMMPISVVFGRFQRMVRDNAGKMNKNIRLQIIGEGTELDKGLIEKISDPLTHLIRNSLDHGIESPEERIAQGKDPQGVIVLSAAHQGGNILIQVSDDGRGLNREKILAKAREKNMEVHDGMTDAEVWSLVYTPGFSTATMVTDVSGRGVGMDVVKKNIEGLGGRVEITSQTGKGSTISVRLPLTLAILDGLSVGMGDQVYIIPLSFIVESFQPKSEDINRISGQGSVVRVRDEYLPLVELYKIFKITPRITDPVEGILVLLEFEGQKVALLVDDLIGQHQVVIKSLETNYKKVVGLSGATIMGDGRVAMIIDVGSLIKIHQKKLP